MLHLFSLFRNAMVMYCQKLHLMQVAHCTGTPFWKLVLKQFDDYLVKVLIAAAVVDLIIALVNGERGAGCARHPACCPNAHQRQRVA